jgi:hypothetical protein
MSLFHSLKNRDIRGAMATAIKNNSIKTPFVRNQYEHFYRNCYSPASGKFQYLVKKGDIIKDEWFFKLWNNDIEGNNPFV